MKYRIFITETCLALIKKIGDKKIQRSILERIGRLSDEPDKQGKMLVKDLSGFRSIHTAGRYRILYKIEQTTVIVYVLAAGTLPIDLVVSGPMSVSGSDGSPTLSSFVSSTTRASRRS